jgi:hypothetical protein
MKMYEVELKRTSCAVIRVEAENEEQAEALAWAELASDGSWGDNYTKWELESINEEEQ